MNERPILFSAPMVRAILDGRKTQTRRLMRPQPVVLTNDDAKAPWLNCGDPHAPRCPYGQPGDRLWVREAWTRCGQKKGAPVVYRADCEDHGGCPECEEDHRWKPSIHMPRAASRITLEVVAVRVERLQDISEIDAQREGVLLAYSGKGEYPMRARPDYMRLWNSINGIRAPWSSNLLVWVIDFRRLP